MFLPTPLFHGVHGAMLDHALGSLILATAFPCFVHATPPVFIVSYVTGAECDSPDDKPAGALVGS